MIRQVSITLMTVLVAVGMLGVFSPVQASRDTACTETCGDGKAAQVNFTCQRARLFEPDSSFARTCELCYCGGSVPGTDPTGEILNLNIFGITLKLNSAFALSQVIYLGFTFFFGVIALAAVGLGIYGAVKRAQAEGEDDIATAQKIITNAIIGLVMVVVSILIAQLLAALLGVGTLNEIVDFSPLFS